MKVVEKLPEGSEVRVASVVESYLIVIVAEGLKFMPDTVAIVPTGPLTGVELRDGGVITVPSVMLKYTWKFAAALSCQATNTSVPETAKLELEISVIGPAVRSLLTFTCG